MTADSSQNLHMYESHIWVEKFRWNCARQLVLSKMTVDNERILDGYYLDKKTIVQRGFNEL